MVYLLPKQGLREHHKIMLKFIQIPGFKGGYSNDKYSSISKQTFQKAENLDIFTLEKVLTSLLRLRTDTTDKTLANIKLNSAIMAADGRVYFRGFDEATGNTLTIWDAGLPVNLDDITAITAEATASGTSSNHGMVEFLSDLFYYESATRIQAFDIGGAAVVTNAVNVNDTMPIFVHTGLKKMFYTVANNQIGATTSATISATALITFEEDQRPVMCAEFGRFVAVGLKTANQSKTSKIAIWDGSSTTIDDLIDIGDVGLQGLVNVGGVLYALVVSQPDNADVPRNLVRIYKIVGSSARLVQEIDCKSTFQGTVTIDTDAITVRAGKIYFGLSSSGNTGILGIDNGVWIYDTLTDLLTLGRTTQDTDHNDILSISFAGNIMIVNSQTSTAVKRLNHNRTILKSAIGVYESNIFPLNGGLRGKINKIYLNHDPIPTSTGFTVAIRHYGNYPWGTSVPSQEAYQDISGPQGSGSSTGKTQSTDNAMFTEISSEKFVDAVYAQIKISIDEVNESAESNAPAIVFPIIIELAD